jgi:predicted dehydrogenase
MDQKHFLIVGAGSVGKRHLRNLTALGCRVSAMDPREDRLDDAGKEAPLALRFTDLGKALERAEEFSGVIIASPPKFHVRQCLDVARANLPLFLEKPVSPGLEDALALEKELEASTVPFVLGYTYRWWPPLRDFRDLIAAGKVGKPLHARFVMSAHLADWHPWERYQDFFMASKELGGGALLDESHFVDLMLWFFGMPSEVFAKVERLSTLEIDTDDNVDILAVFESGLRVTIHLDLYGRPHEKFISVTGEKGTARWSFDPNRVEFASGMEHAWEGRDYAFERNEMFVRAAQEFVAVADGRAKPSCTLGDGVDVLRVLEACRTSSDTGRSVRLTEKEG